MGEEERALRRPVVHGSRMLSWVERRADSVRKLRLKGGFDGAFVDISSEALGRLIAITASSLTEIRVHYGYCCFPYLKLFWKSVPVSVAPHGRLRSFVVERIRAVVFESDVEPLGQLTGSLEELVLTFSDSEIFVNASPLSRLPESFCALTELRRLKLSHL